MRKLILSVIALGGIPLFFGSCSNKGADLNYPPVPTDMVSQDTTQKSSSQKEQKNTEVLADIPVVIRTSRGDIKVVLYASKTPITVANFLWLAKRGYYDGLAFHRVIPNFMIQTGDPTGTGAGGPGYKFEDEIRSDLRYVEPGVLGMANPGIPNSNGSQFFITHIPTPWLNGKHTIFGRVVQGQDVVNSIMKNDTIESIQIGGSTESLFQKEQNYLNDWKSKLTY